MTKTNRRLSESAGMLMIGDGVLGLLYPSQHCWLWAGGPQWWNDTIDWFAAHPQLTRVCAATELAAGLWLASAQMTHPFRFDRSSEMAGTHGSADAIGNEFSHGPNPPRG